MSQRRPDNTKDRIKNPGLVLNLIDKYNQILPMTFDGLRVIVHRGLSRHFRVSHNIFLSSITPGNYRFGATYVGNNIVNEHESYPVLLGDIDSRGNMNATMYHLVGSRLKLRLDSQMEKGSFINSQLAAHYLADSSTSSLIVTNPDVLRNSGSMILQHLQNITPGLAIGMECAVMYNIARRKSMETTNLLSQLSLMGRYSTPLSAWSIILSKNNVLLNCYKKASEQIEFGMEINSNLRSTVFQTVGTLGFKVTLPDRGVILRGSVDTNTNVASVYQKRICNTPFAILVSTNLNHKSGNFRFGLGFIIE